MSERPKDKSNIWIVIAEILRLAYELISIIKNPTVVMVLIFVYLVEALSK